MVEARTAGYGPPVPQPFLLGLLAATITAGPVVGVIGFQLGADSQYLWLLVPLVVLVCTIAVMASQGTRG
ncbi:MAG: hypothetical protein K0Q93_2510 [Nocardioidaceae bacterium]|nr:hypothetical protein [Nocardioidaceae bacterium]